MRTIDILRPLAGALFLSLPLAACAEPPQTVTADAVHQRMASDEAMPLIVDVREPHEYRSGHIEGARLAPLGNVARELEDVEKDSEIVLVCRSGNRSGKAQAILEERGYTRVFNMEGGMLAWEKRGHPVTK